MSFSRFQILCSSTEVLGLSHPQPPCKVQLCVWSLEVGGGVHAFESVRLALPFMSCEFSAYHLTSQS